ncbi:Peptidyl-prolyl cis-trans isomerase fkbp42 [Ranunculus cassubicifolius]
MKLKGNALFKDEKLTEAIQQYEKVLAYLGDTLVANSSHKHREMVLGVKIPCHLNIAACFLKLKRYEETINHSNFVLAEDENHVKALYRRGKAKAELGRTDAAREDFVKASNLSPSDKTIKNELLLLAESEKKAVYEKQKELYKGIFGPRVETDTDTKHDDNILPGNINNSATPKLTHRVKAHYNGSGDHW